VAARANSWVCGRSLAGFVSSNTLEGTDFSFVNVVCFQVEFPSSGSTLFQRSPTECGVTIEGKLKPLKTGP